MMIISVTLKYPPDNGGILPRQLVNLGNGDIVLTKL